MADRLIGEFRSVREKKNPETRREGQKRKQRKIMKTRREAKRRGERESSERIEGMGEKRRGASAEAGEFLSPCLALLSQYQHNYQ